MIILTNRNEVAARTGRPLNADEDAVFDALAADVSALIYATAPRLPSTLPVPHAAVACASRLVIEGLALATAPGGAAAGSVQSEALGGYSVVYATGDDAGGGLSLSQSMLNALAPWLKPKIGSVEIDPSNAVAW